MKIGFATDTNILERIDKSDLYTCKSVLDTTDIYIDYIEDLPKTKSQCELTYYMPEIVQEELLEQRKSAFNESYDNFVKKYDGLSFALNGEIPKSNIDELLQSEREKYSDKFKLIKLKYTSELFEKMVNDALKKNAPFDKRLEGKKADAGFKDALIWQTIIHSKEIDDCDEFYFFTADLVFKDGEEELVKEFNKHHNKTKINIINIKCEGSQRQEVLNTLISKYNLYKTDVIKLYNKEIIIQFIRKMKYKNEDVFYYSDDKIQVKLVNIDYASFDLSDFYIEEVEKEKDKFKIKCFFKTRKYETNNDTNIIDKKILNGIITIDLKEEEKEELKYECINCNASKINFNTDIFDLIRGLSINLSSTLTSEVLNAIKENMKSYQELLDPLKGVREAIASVSQESMNVYKAALDPLKDIKSLTTFNNKSDDKK